MTEELWGEKPNRSDEKYDYEGKKWVRNDKLFRADMDAWLAGAKDKLEWQEQHNKQMWMNLCIANKKLAEIVTFIKAKMNSNDPAYSICVGVQSILEGDA